MKRTKKRAWSGWLVRGELFVASTGLAVAAIIMLVVGGGTWWAIQTQSRALQSQATEHAQSFARALRVSAESMLADGELSSLRRLLLECHSNGSVRECRITLADGTVVASSDPSLLSPGPLPQRWQGQAQAELFELTSTGVAISLPLVVPGRGQGTLYTAVAFDPAANSVWLIKAGAVAVCSLGLLMLLGVYRRMRSRLGGVSVVCESLMSMAAGERRREVLEVHESFGPEAKAWNELLAEREQLAMHKIEQQLAVSERRDGGASISLTTVCDAMPQGLILVDRHLKVIYVNGAGAVLLRKGRDGFVGSSLDEVITDEGIGEAVRSVISGTARPKASTEIERDGEDGGGVLRIIVRSVRRADHAEAMIQIEDVTQQRLADRAHNALLAQATHELRTPLTNIRLYVEQALDEGESDPSVRARALNVINSEARRLERIVGDLLSVSEMEAGSFSLRTGDVRLDQLFFQIEEDYRAQAAEKGIELRFELPPKMAVIVGDRDKITLALNNLIGNGLKYTKRGGKVIVHLDCPEDGSLRVTVTDSGMGIGADDLGRIFDKFYRAQDERVQSITGSGLGLALSREIARMHGGDIEVVSTIDQGSTFTLTLPAAAGRAAA